MLILRTLEKVVLEISIADIERDGFDTIWDKIRNIYSVNRYDVSSIEQNKKNETMFLIELVKKKTEECS